MANLCEYWVPEYFWRKAYNLSSGSKWRLTTWEFLNLNMLGLGSRFEDVYDPRQQALFNFHGQWYTDADILEEKLHFRCVDFNQYCAGVKAEIDALKANPMISAMLLTAEQMKVNNEMVAIWKWASIGCLRTMKKIGLKLSLDLKKNKVK